MVSRSEEEFGRIARREAVSSRDCHKHGSCNVDPVAVETENLIPQHIEPRCSEPTCVDNTKRQKQPLFIRQGETATEVVIIRIHGTGQEFYRIATVVGLSNFEEFAHQGPGLRAIGTVNPLSPKA